MKKPTLLIALAVILGNAAAFARDYRGGDRSDNRDYRREDRNPPSSIGSDQVGGRINHI